MGNYFRGLCNWTSWETALGGCEMLALFSFNWLAFLSIWKWLVYFTSTVKGMSNLIQFSLHAHLVVHAHAGKIEPSWTFLWWVPESLLKQSGIDQWAPHCPSLSETHTHSHYYTHHTKMKQTHTQQHHTNMTHIQQSLFIKIYIVKSASSSVHSIQRWSRCWRVEMEGQVHLKMTQPRVSYIKTKEKVDRTVCYCEHFLFDARLFFLPLGLGSFVQQHSTPPYPLTTQHSALPTAQSPTHSAKQNVAVRRQCPIKYG